MNPGPRCGAGGPLPSTHRTVLIIDDDPTVLDIFGRMLRLGGYGVLTALDVKSGFHTLETEKPDAVLLDLRMPGMDGLRFLRRLRAREQDHQTPVAIITGDYFLDEATARELRELGATLYYKPFWVDDLIEITERLLGGTG